MPIPAAVNPWEATRATHSPDCSPEEAAGRVAAYEASAPGPPIMTPTEPTPITCKATMTDDQPKAIETPTRNNGKAQDEQEIFAELLKIDIDAAADLLTPLIEIVWRTRNVPEQWRNSTIIYL